MSIELQLENFGRDNMDGEIHSDQSCHTETTIYKYTDALGNDRKLLFIFMVCNCGKKPANPHLNFDPKKLIISGDGMDTHLPDKDCNYQVYAFCEPSDPCKRKFRFKCFCYCRNENRTAIH